jgi:DNA repair exonuclease SbcCD nuclease subunit
MIADIKYLKGNNKMSEKFDKFFWFRNNRILIDGVKREHLFMHISDLHLHVIDDLSTPEEKAKAIEKESAWLEGKEKYAESAGEPFGDEQRISSVAAFEKHLKLAEKLRPEALLITGDTLNYMHPAGERYLRKKLMDYKNKGGQFICVPGNHEDDNLVDLWDAQLRVYEFEGFRIIAVNDNKHTLEDESILRLEALCNENIPLIIICHIPLLTDSCRNDIENAGAYFYIDENSEDIKARKFVSIIKNCDTVKAVVCGHLHRYVNCEIATGKSQIIGSQGMAGAVDLITVCGK